MRGSWSATGISLAVAAWLAAGGWGTLRANPAGPDAVAETEILLVVFTEGQVPEYFAFTEPELARARGVLEEALGERWAGSKMGLVLDILQDPFFFPKFEFTLSTSGAVQVMLELYPNDHPNELFVGERLREVRRGAGGELERGDPYVVRRGDTLGALAARWGVTVDEAVRTLSPRFAVWPHRSTLHIGGERVPVIRLGETQLAGALHPGDDEWTESDIRYLLLHEGAHVGDAAECPGAAEFYGPDGSHDLREVITPAAAFTEGWGNYRGLHAHDFDRGMDYLDGYGDQERTVRERRYRYPFLGVEVSDPVTHPRGAPGKYVVIHCADLDVHDMISSELLVARVLWEIQGLSLDDHATVRALRDSNDVPCRALPDFLSAYLEAFPEHLPDVDWLLELEYGEIVTPEERDLLLAGRIPMVEGRHLERDQRPRNETYRPGPGFEPETCTRGPPAAGAGASTREALGQ